MSIQQFPGDNSSHGEDMPERLIAQRGASSWVDHAAAAEAWERQHEAEWARVDQKLRGIAARRAALDAEEAHLLRYAEELKLWRAYGFGSLIEYMERAMGYAPHTATERLRVARAIAELPLIAEALEQGELAHSAVRELSRVAVPDTEEAWLEAARGKSLREIEAMVSGHRPGHLPTDDTEPRLHRKTLTIEVSPETYDLWRKMHALAAEEHGQRLSDDELIPSVFRRAYGDGNASSGGNDRDGGKASSPAYKIALKQCPDCKRAWQYSGGRDIEVDPAVVECAACDAVHLGSLDAAAPERATTTVTTRKREQVLARDGHSCTVPGCRRNVGLDLHHITYQSRGGGHELWNVISICDLHHRAVHFGKLVIRGTAPDRVTYEFRKPRDRRNITDDDAPAPAISHPSPAPPSPAPPSAAPPSPAASLHPAASPPAVRPAAPPSPAPSSAASPFPARPHRPTACSAACQPAAPSSLARAASSPEADTSRAGPPWAADPPPPRGAADLSVLSSRCQGVPSLSLLTDRSEQAAARGGADLPALALAGEPKPTRSPPSGLEWHARS
jgi:hypothetical protein